MVQSMNDNNPLSGVKVLVVEDDTLLAMDLKETLVDAGAIVVGVCQTLDEGMARADDDDFAVAVLDFTLGSDTASPLARRLVRRSTRGSPGANRAWLNGAIAQSWKSRLRRACWCRQ
jgi:ActR/RegA family two-component response regulator